MGRRGRKKAPEGWREKKGNDSEVGDDLLYREVTLRVPSALAGLTTGFEMGPGVPPPLETPTTLSIADRIWNYKCISQRPRR